MYAENNSNRPPHFRAPGGGGVTGGALSRLEARYAGRLSVNHALARSLVSFQQSRTSPLARWFPYREGFSSDLVKTLLARLRPEAGVLLDPFSGSGSALLAARGEIANGLLHALEQEGSLAEALPTGFDVDRDEDGATCAERLLARGVTLHGPCTLRAEEPTALLLRDGRGLPAPCSLADLARCQIRRFVA